MQDGRVLVEAVVLAGHLLLKLNERTNPLSPKYYQLVRPNLLSLISGLLLSTRTAGG